MNSGARLFFVNPRTPKPCALGYELIHQAAKDRWQDASVSREESTRWFDDGAPDKDSALLGTIRSLRLTWHLAGELPCVRCWVGRILQIPMPRAHGLSA